MLSGCSSSPVKPNAVPLPESKDGRIEVLVEDGESSQAVYSAKGDKLLFVSRKRPGHQQDQVYEKDLATGIERRLTFQNGNTFHPQYHPKENWILYSSSTDELKENPPLLRASQETLKLPHPYTEPFELYIHSLKEFDINRVTDHGGFDGYATFNNDGNVLTFTRVNGERSEVVVFNRSLRSAHSLKNLGSNPSEYVHTSDGKARAWLDWEAGFTKNRIRLQKGKEEPRDVVPMDAPVKMDLNFSPDGKWLLWSQHSSDGYDIWAADTDTLCPRRLLLNSEGERRDPVVSPDGKWLTYTLIFMGRSRIARMAFSPPSGTCPAAP